MDIRMQNFENRAKLVPKLGRIKDRPGRHTVVPRCEYGVITITKEGHAIPHEPQAMGSGCVKLHTILMRRPCEGHAKATRMIHGVVLTSQSSPERSHEGVT